MSERADQRLIAESVVRAALLEDLGQLGDLTTDAIVPLDVIARAAIAARKEGIVAGLDVALLAFELLDPSMYIERLHRDGDRLAQGEQVVLLQGSARVLLSAERTALNFLCHLSGVATATRRLVDAIAEYDAMVVDTRKTTPGLRAFEKAAVRAGGGVNHRFGLDDAVLIKDNHVALVGGVREAVRRVRERIGHMVKVQLEIDTLEQAHEARDLPIDAVLLDNMTPQQLREAVAILGDRFVVEASGSVTLETIVPIAAAGVDLISAGWITHSAPALDLGLDLLP